MNHTPNRAMAGLSGRAPRILVVGGGGREHAIAWKLREEHPNATILAAPGNPGIAELGRCLDVPVTDVDRMTELAVREKVDLVVVGPEVPLSLGLVDRLRHRKVPVFGPTQAAARIETSKAFAKQIMACGAVPTARAEVHTDAHEARRAVRSFGAPVVIKATGLAAGKGVVVCQSMGEAYEAIDMMLLARGMGEAGAEILVEEFMQGEELSLFYLTDGTHAIPLVGAQDHKRLGEGDQGPNTGGMGAYGPVSISTPALVEEVTQTIVLPTLRALADHDCPFTGVLYVGLMLTASGPRVVEFNCRFGDPETQAILPLIDCRPTLFDLLLAIAKGERLPEDARVRVRGCGVTTVVAAPGYPEAPRTGEPLVLPRVDDPGVFLFHAGTRRAPSGELQSAGGRVVAVTAVAASLAEAHRESLAYAERVKLAGAQFRRDIAWRELERLSADGSSLVAGR
ncbi:MAG TPA: phosphoribosylamine--glycine ligase [Gemmatimonadaceae bacterium]|nr:phosphoribosylamine--glycine ligase [Gemmatimonadaceae bacterium]